MMPEPILRTLLYVAARADAHGTNAEWYGVVCGCISASGLVITARCLPTCTCNRECAARGYYGFESAWFAVTGGVCRCGFDDPRPEVPPSQAPEDGPSFSVAFSRNAVIFEDEYENGPRGTMPRQSTRVRLTVSAYGGPHGGMLELASQHIDRLVAVEGEMSLPAFRELQPGESFFETCVYEGAQESWSEDEVRVSGQFADVLTGDRLTDSAELTVVRVAMEAVAQAQANRNRHVFGPLERSTIRIQPWNLQLGLSDLSMCSQIPASTDTILQFTNQACSAGVRLSYGGVEFPMSFTVIEPDSRILVTNPRELPEDEWMPFFDEHPLESGEAGVAWIVDGYLTPSYVSFGHLRVMEMGVPASGIWGCCTNQDLFPTMALFHQGTNAPIDEGGPGEEVGEDNRIGTGDRIAFWPTSRLAFPCEPGGFAFAIPVKWYSEDRLRTNSLDSLVQRIQIKSDGTVGVSKYGFSFERKLTGEFSPAREE